MAARQNYGFERRRKEYCPAARSERLRLDADEILDPSSLDSAGMNAKTIPAGCDRGVERLAPRFGGIEGRLS